MEEVQPIRKTLGLIKIDYYETHLSIINCILPKKMTPMQIKVLATFMSLEGSITVNRFGPSGRKLVMAALNLSPSGLSNYISDLTNAKFLKEVGDILTIWPLLEPKKDKQSYILRLINTDGQQPVQ